MHLDKNISQKIKPFSENISTGSNFLDISVYEDRYKSTPDDVTVEALKKGRDLQAKLRIYENQAGIIKKSPRWWWMVKNVDSWDNEKELQFHGYQSDEYNLRLLRFFQNKDREYLSLEAVEGKEKLSKSLAKYLKKESKELLGKQIKKLTGEEKAKLYATKGIVPPWWWVFPELEPAKMQHNEIDKYMIDAAKAIRRARVSAYDIQLIIEKAGRREALSPIEQGIIIAGWGGSKAQKIFKGKYPITKKTFETAGPLASARSV